MTIMSDVSGLSYLYPLLELRNLTDNTGVLLLHLALPQHPVLVGFTVHVPPPPGQDGRGEHAQVSEVAVAVQAKHRIELRKNKL